MRRPEAFLPTDVNRTEGPQMAADVSRRNFLGGLGVSVGAALGATAGGALPVVGGAEAQGEPKGTIPDNPFPIGHMTFFTGPAAGPRPPLYQGQRPPARGCH